jgi:hypothetical protein
MESGLFVTFFISGEVCNVPESARGARSTGWLADWLASVKMTSPAVSKMTKSRPPLPQWGVKPTHLNFSSGRHLPLTMLPKSLT